MNVNWFVQSYNKTHSNDLTNYTECRLTDSEVKQLISTNTTLKKQIKIVIKLYKCHEKMTYTQAQKYPSKPNYCW